MAQPIQYAENYPNHETLGHCFTGTWGSIYYCDSSDPSMGYWMTPLLGSEDVKRTNVSERAIGRTYHKIRPELYQKRGITPELIQGILQNRSAN